jgi:hypothetical protein
MPLDPNGLRALLAGLDRGLGGGGPLEGADRDREIERLRELGVEGAERPELAQTYNLGALGGRVWRALRAAQ